MVVSFREEITALCVLKKMCLCVKEIDVERVFTNRRVMLSMCVLMCAGRNNVECVVCRKRYDVCMMVESWVRLPACLCLLCMCMRMCIKSLE